MFQSGAFQSRVFQMPVAAPAVTRPPEVVWPGLEIRRRAERDILLSSLIRQKRQKIESQKEADREARRLAREATQIIRDDLPGGLLTGREFKTLAGIIGAALIAPQFDTEEFTEGLADLDAAIMKRARKLADIRTREVVQDDEIILFMLLTA